jgi:riboflavin kinase, archaea type
VTRRGPPEAALGTRRRWKHEEIALLKHLARSGADRTPAMLSSREVGATLGVSQQAADRYLVALAKLGLIARSLGGRKQVLTLTPAGTELLRREYHDLRRVFEGPARLKVAGVVASGLGEGRYYLSQPGYVVQFAERLGYTPYPGTLNVRLASPDLLRVSGVREWRGIRIDGFSTAGRTFGGANCHVARLGGRPCHLITPDRTHHTDVAEFIAPVYLRDALHVKDGDRVEVEIEES